MTGLVTASQASTASSERLDGVMVCFHSPGKICLADVYSGQFLLETAPKSLGRKFCHLGLAS